MKDTAFKVSLTITAVIGPGSILVMLFTNQEFFKTMAFVAFTVSLMILGILFYVATKHIPARE